MINGWVDEGWVDDLIDGWMNVHRWTIKWMSGLRKSGWDEWMDRWMDGQFVHMRARCDNDCVLYDRLT